MSEPPYVGQSVAVTSKSAGDASGTRLHGMWLELARATWLVLIIASLATFAAGVPAYLASLTQPTADDPPVTPGSAEALQHIGVSGEAYALTAVIISCAIVLTSIAMAIVLFRRRGDDWMVLLVSLFVVLYPIGSSAVSGPALPALPSTVATALYLLLQLAIGVVEFGGFFLFPTGRFVPSWSWIIMVAYVIWLAAGNITALDAFGGLLVFGYPLFYGIAIVNIVSRYRHVSTPVQRQQTKWVVAGLAVSLLANQAFWLPGGLTPLGDTLYAPLSYLVYQIAILAVPITFFIAIQRYRLYDIDTIINRVLVYGALTAILALVYVGGVFGLQALVGVVTGQAGQNISPVLIVVTTLTIAALVNPLRMRLQRTVDRRFYRSKYDAARILAAFGASLRNQTDLDQLGGDLLLAVEETLHPAHTSLWLRPELADAKASVTPLEPTKTSS